jgi:Protein of unknown function (DUF4238)
MTPRDCGRLRTKCVLVRQTFCIHMRVVASVIQMNRPARRHHYLSRFLMRGFSERPDAENPPIWRLDKKTGKPSRTSVNSDAVVKDFYRLEEVPGLEATRIEEDLARIEGIAAPHLNGLLAGGNLSEVARFEFATYLALQHRRTPRGRQWFVEMHEHASKLMQSVGAHKGVMFSTSGFQRGAVDFAKTHGIALVSVTEGRFMYETKSAERRPALTREEAKEMWNLPTFAGQCY